MKREADLCGHAAEPAHMPHSSASSLAVEAHVPGVVRECQGKQWDFDL